MVVKKKPRAEVKAHYGLYVQFGFVLTLLLLIIAFRVEYCPKAEVAYVAPAQEVVQMEEILQTKQIQKPPRRRVRPCLSRCPTMRSLKRKAWTWMPG